MSKVLGIIGSPRNKGNTHVLVNEMLDEARLKGAETEVIQLGDMKIEECIGCHVCWKGKPCVKNDDMNDLYQKISDSDILIFGTPIYWYGPTALMKGFIDRFVYFNCPENKVHLEGKKAVTVIPFEEDEMGMSSLTRAFFEKCFDYLSINYIADISVPGVTKPGEVSNNPVLLLNVRQLVAEII